MKEFQLREHQTNAINSIRRALNQKQKHIVVEMPNGCGKGIVLAKTVELLTEIKNGNVLIVTDRIELRKNIERNLFKGYQDFIQVDKDDVIVETSQRILRYPNEKTNEYKFVIFYDMSISRSIYEAVDCKEKTIIVFSASNQKLSHSLFTPKDVVFSYSYEDAINDGFLTPAMDTRALGPAVESFSKQILEQFGYTQVEPYASAYNIDWDLVVEKNNHKIWVECKAYKSQVISPTVANSLLKTVLMQKIKQGMSEEDIVLLVVLSNIPILEKDGLFKRHKIIVWDIENLVFYSKNSPALIKQLSQVTYFPIDYIEGQISDEAEKAGLSLVSTEKEIVYEIEKDDNKTIELIQRLKECKAGKKYSGEYEDVCEEIMRSLFEVNYFNRLTRQHKTKDEHFRMDLIGS